MDEKNHYLMETNLKADKTREIKELTEKSSRWLHSALIVFWFNFSSQYRLWLLESQGDCLPGINGNFYQSKFGVVLHLQYILQNNPTIVQKKPKTKTNPQKKRNKK